MDRFTKRYPKPNTNQELQRNGASATACRKLPAMLADSEIAHLETVASYLLNTEYRELPGYLGPAYWIARAVSIGEQFELVLPQRRRLTALLAMFMSLAQSSRCAPEEVPQRAVNDAR
ncbi:hypothetical protein ABIE53_001164 [Burkholderia sp. OAS925]|uniref:hypothetical protein n=1 Tax=Paraburkholderia TaxID=1822464 RepID=UPI001789D22D|nr:hypothetical protein [Paraburkholderia graminis]MDR6477298.1 hypothetical protein [Paraburkholderia graminis]